MAKHVPVRLGASAFNCPMCGAYSSQLWFGAEYKSTTEQIEGLHISRCLHCGKTMLWYEDRLVMPQTSSAPMAHEAMPEGVLTDYEEARGVFNFSPRSSAALLRLATQKLCIELGLPGNNLNDDIGELVKRGLPVRVQRALD